MSNIDFGYTYNYKRDEPGVSLRLKTVSMCDEIDRIIREIDVMQAEVNKVEVLSGFCYVKTPVKIINITA